MEYLNVLNNDKDYQNIVGQYKEVTNKYKQLVNKRLHNKQDLFKLTISIENDLSNMLKSYYEKKRSELENELVELQNEQVKTGYAERQAEAKEFEIRYKLADDHELKSIADNVKSDDLLELNLLRMELKERGLNDHERKVKHYIMYNKLDKNPENEAKIEELQKGLATINTLPKNAFYVDNALKTVDGVKKELTQLLDNYEQRKPTKQDLIDQLTS